MREIRYSWFGLTTEFTFDEVKFAEGRKYLTTPEEYDHVIPISKLIVFTEHRSDVRRRGVAFTIKYLSSTSSHYACIMPMILLQYSNLRST